MAFFKYGSSSSANQVIATGRTEFEILRDSHKFLRPEDENEKSLSWNEQVAKKYYSNLYREFAVCDLKHYKSGNFSLRWRTEDEVISGAGETTCGNSRCPFHDTHHVEQYHPSLTTLELPFSYVEDGESKFALVKVVLCPRCVKKLMYKRKKEKEEQGESLRNEVKEEPQEVKLEEEGRSQVPRADEEGSRTRDERRRERRHRSPADAEGRRRSSRSRSRSPARRGTGADHRRRTS